MAAVPEQRTLAERLGKRRDGSGLPRVTTIGIWCYGCRSYRPSDEFGFPPSFGGRPTPECLACRNARDATRPKRRRGTPEWERDRERRVRDQRRQAAERAAERAAFVAGAIGTLRRRGLTKAEIRRLIGTTDGALLAWERRARRPTPNAAERFVVALRATAHLPTGPMPRRRRIPHPELPALVERVAPTLAAFPLRSRWRGRGGAEPVV